MPNSDICLSARSVSRSVSDWLRSAPMTGRVLSVSRCAWLAQFGEGRLLSIVAPEVGDGPLNVVLEQAPSEWTELKPGAPVRVQQDGLCCGRLEMSWATAVHWEPCPDWERLRASAATLLGHLGRLRHMVQGHAPEGSMLPVVQGQTEAIGARLGPVYARARAAAEALWAGWCGDGAQLSAGAARLAGLGVGLTPSGDDFLLGTMLCAWLAHPMPTAYCAAAAGASVLKTTLLSAAYLRSAAEGQFGAPWHRLLDALEAGSDEDLAAAAHAVLAYGHTSGADALAGFLWMGQRVLGG